MKHGLLIFILCFLLINTFIPKYESKFKSNALEEDRIYDITGEITGDTNHKKAEFSFNSDDINVFFKHDIETLPSSLITTFRIDFDQYSTDISNFKVLCTNVDKTTSDTVLINTLKNLAAGQSACKYGFKNNYYYDSIVRLDSTKQKLGIMLKYTESGKQFTGRVNLRTVERILETSESKPVEDERYTLVPFTIKLLDFRAKDKTSKILFYSFSRDLTMFYAGSEVYPMQLFSGNILSVYTNPNMIRQKYQGAETMVLWVYAYGSGGLNKINKKIKEEDDFLFEVNLFKSEFLLDYFVSSNEEGRPLNSPLLINMTECTQPYYVILNYNRAEEKKALIIDQIYGKIKTLSMANDFTKETWEEMLESDMKELNIGEGKYELPENMTPHLDVYKIECELPIMMNFYYINEADLISKMNYGNINLFTLKSYEVINVPFFKLQSPEIVIEIYNPNNPPTVIIKVEEEKVYQGNMLITLIPDSLTNGITFKERGGLSDTRIIIKVGYSNNNWQDTSDENVKYNAENNVYAFSFPSDAKMYNYSYANLITSGTNADDNVKYCFNTNIGAALKPSSENCYRVSKDNFYTLKAFNPLTMYKDYDYNPTLKYYVTFQPKTTVTEFKVESELITYDTLNRNTEGESIKVTTNSDNEARSILTPPSINSWPVSFLQIQVCDTSNSVKAHIIKPLTGEIVYNEKTIPAGAKNQYIIFPNVYLDSELILQGSANTNIFLRLVGLPYSSDPIFNDNYQITFDSSINTLSIEPPVESYELMKYTVIIDSQATLSKLTLCDFTIGNNIETLGRYHKSITADGIGSIHINFQKAGLKAGDTFYARVYIEQLMFSRMVFLTDVYQNTVGDITTGSVNEIKDEYDSDYDYITIKGQSSVTDYYFSYTPTEINDIAFGTLRIQLDDNSEGSFTGVYCAFVNKGVDAFDMIEEVENMIDVGDSYCVGAKSEVNSKEYNYIFKYNKNSDNTPKVLVIKIVNGNLVNGNFNIYVRKASGISIERTDFTEQKEYGVDEKNKKSLIPYIVDLNKIRGGQDEEKISKILFYSQNSELQMYYVPTDQMVPIKLFSGNIALVYTKPELATQKYHSTKLILLSQSFEGGASLTGFRFHTKMFKSEDQIEFYVSQNAFGRTLNFPLSLEMNVCTQENKKLYYLLNYNKEEENRVLHLEMVFGSYSRARIATQINQEKWDDLINYSMEDIINYEVGLPSRPQHIDIIEIECLSPLLINAYYVDESYEYNNVKEGEIVVKDVRSDTSYEFTLEHDTSETSTFFYYSISLFNPMEKPYGVIRFSNGVEHYISDNTLQDGMLIDMPSSITIINNAKTKSRFIFKFGINVEKSSKWKEDDSVSVNGTLFLKENTFVYRFPLGDEKKSYKTVDFTVTGLTEDVENVKFCYSTNLGVVMEVSKENCFRTGRSIPYTLSFINPLIVAKNYDNNIDKYYITLRPYEYDEHMQIKIVENKYDVTNRNEEGVAKQITINEGVGKTILSLAEDYTSNILIQIRSCTASEDPIAYTIKNAFTETVIKEGKTYFYKDEGYGIIYVTDNAYLENEVILNINDTDLTAKAFVKHVAIGNNRFIIQDGYKDLVFDRTKNSVTIKKPIYNEEFIITIVVHYKGQLTSYTLCDFSFKTEEEIKKYGKYYKSFTSVKSNSIIHFIDFDELEMAEGTEFDLLVYAKQKNNAKMEFLYPVFNGKVGKISGVESVSNYIEDNNYATLQFEANLNSNYLYFDFALLPYGRTAALKIKSPTVKVNKVGCTFVPKDSSDSTMVSKINNAMMEDLSVCIDLGSNDKTEFNALVNANYTGNNLRLVMQIIYSEDNNNANSNQKLKDDEFNTINIKLAGTQFGDHTGVFDITEQYAPTPYVINLLDIRDQKIGTDYISKLLIYSNTTEMYMYQLSDSSPLPKLLFSGNIMLVYTNPELIKQKYNGATTMILTTNALSNNKNTVNVKHLNSDAQYQYFVSENQSGRVLNNPTGIEMTSCLTPFYYILNYNKYETESRKMHIDKIFGEVESIKIATSLKYNSFDKLVDSMTTFDGEEIILQSDQKTHFDILEVKCKIPLLLNVYYSDPTNIKTKSLEVGDIVILSLDAGKEQTLEFKQNQKGPFVYSFNINRDHNTPDIQIIFPDGTDLEAKENGLYTNDASTNYEKLTIKNNVLSGEAATRIIFKFGYVIESTFTKDSNGVYSNKDVPDRTINLYGYKYDTTSKRLNYTGVDFIITTSEENVKFCYSTNIGTYINPSTTNCYRVGWNNPYTISTRNPLVMYKDYHLENINYYVGFRTIDFDQKITITPKKIEYNTKERNIEGARNKLKITGDTGEYSTILTAPKNKEPYIFTHIHVCTPGKGLYYEFLNGYNSSSLGYSGNINPDTKNNYMSVPNTKLDTELKLKGDNGVEVYVKHVGVDKKKTIFVEKSFNFGYDKETHKLNWTQPIKYEDFIYTIYIDKSGNIERQHYTLCSITEVSKLGHYSEIKQSDEKSPFITIDFSKPELVNYQGNFEVIIVAEQVNSGKLTILSEVYNPNKTTKVEEESNNGLIILIVILSVVIIAGAIASYFIIKKYKSKGTVSEDNKATSMAMLSSTKDEKLVESQASENMDP